MNKNFLFFFSLTESKTKKNFFKISDILLLAGSKLNGDGIDIDITFQQFPFRHDITVMLNGTGLPVGKHALHIHSYGDLGNECRNTGGQFRHTFVIEFFYLLYTNFM